MKILFLDIDGVVLPGRAYELPYQTKPIVKKFDPCSVSLLNKICESTGHKIVIHSSWLRYFDKNLDGMTVTEWCIQEGINADHFHAESECHPVSWRYDRIDEWLARHKEVDDFIILDDTPPEDGYPRADKVVLTDFDEGITMSIFRKLVY